MTKREQTKESGTKTRGFCKTPKATTRFKLLIYDATIKSKLIYGLESASLANIQLLKLDTFQLKGL